MQTMFLVEDSMNLVLDTALPRVREIINELDEIECEMSSSRRHLAVEAVGGIKIRRDEIDAREHEYVRWASRLSDLLGAPIYKYAYRFNELFSAMSVNVSVRR